MKTIKVQPWDPDNMRDWEQAAGSYFASIKQSRDGAFALLRHPDWVARVAAIKAFLYHWDFDLDVAKVFHALAKTDEHVVVRFNAAAFLSLAHRICEVAEDEFFLEDLLEDIVKAPGQEPEIIDELKSYLDRMPDSSDVGANVHVGSRQG